MENFRGLLVEKDDAGYRAGLKTLDASSLGEGDVTVAVDFSTLNYKDALALTGASPVVRSFPLIPGIDFAGTVVESEAPDWKPGDKVVLNGWGLGETAPGGLAEYARVPGGYLVRLPDTLSSQDAMAFGTAGYTAMLCLMALEAHEVTPEKGDILVTGASGGVGSVAVALLAAKGYRVVASTGKVDEADYLKALGASEIIDRKELSEPGKPLQKERWAGVVDSVGSHTLANACAQTKADGAVAACGLAQGMDFPATVAPFILRGVTLCGINSVYMPVEKRAEAWKRLASDVDPAILSSITSDPIGLEDALRVAPDFLEGKVRGRVVVDVRR